MREPDSARHVPWLLAVAIAAVVLHAFYFYPFFVDDSYISMRYAQRLLTGKGLSWNDHELVEGYSNLLWVLLTAGLGWLGFTLEGAARALGVACAVLTVPVFFRHARAASLSFWTLPLAVILFATIPPVGIWAISGMETCMVMLCFAWAVALSYQLIYEVRTKQVIEVGALLGLICLLRPEGPVYTLALAGGLAVTSRLAWPTRLRVLAMICGIALVFFAGELAFRLSVYGQWVPNTALVKVAFTQARLVYGFVFSAKALFSFLPLLLYVAFNGWSLRGKAAERDDMRYLALLLIVSVAMSVAIALAGGDIFPGFRPFVPLMPLFILMVMHAAQLGLRYAAAKKEMIFLGYIVACHIWLQLSIDVNQQPKKANWEPNAAAIGLALKERYGAAQPLVAVHAAGAIPFYSELPSLDIYGLNDPELPKHRAEQKRFGQQLAGHELFDGAYVDSKKPDVLAFDIPGLPPLCVEDFEKECRILLPHYRPETLHIPGHDVTVWVRKDSAKFSERP